MLPWIRITDDCTVAVAGPDAVWLNADGPLQTLGKDDSTVAHFTVPAGRRFEGLWLVRGPRRQFGIPR